MFWERKCLAMLSSIMTDRVQKNDIGQAVQVCLLCAQINVASQTIGAR